MPSWVPAVLTAVGFGLTLIGFILARKAHGLFTEAVSQNRLAQQNLDKSIEIRKQAAADHVAAGDALARAREWTP